MLYMSISKQSSKPLLRPVAKARGWAHFCSWRIDRASETPLFRQIYREIRTAVLSQTLPRGTRLPSTRELASQIGVSRTSVISAYEQLSDEGYISGRLGSGYYVSFDPPEPITLASLHRSRETMAPVRPTGVLAHSLGEFADSTAQWDERAFNTGRTLVDSRTVEIWRKLTNRALRSLGSDLLGYSDPRGSLELRKTICDYLRAARGVHCDPDQIIVTSGTQQAIDIAIRVLLHPGDEAWIEDPGYPLIRYALVAAGVKIRPIRVDSEGICVSKGIRSAPKARAAFVTPSHQFPTGVVLSMARRLELLQWARETGAWIIEDDYASEFRYSGRPLASLQGLNEGKGVIYAGTLNKVLFAGLRVGYVVAPRPLLQAFVNTRYVLDRQPPSVGQLVLCEFMREGYFAAHIRRMRLLYQQQRDALVDSLKRRLGEEVGVDVPDQGLHLVAYLRDGVPDIDLEAAARRNGIVVRAISRLYMRPPKYSGLMLGFSGYPRQVIIPAAARLAQVVCRQSNQSHRSR
jgi:GntR family transcriptional regulator/MocR family aminotransferase